MISKGHKPAVAQQMLNLIARGLEQEYLPFARQYSIPTLVYNPLAGGLLTGTGQHGRLAQQLRRRVKFRSMAEKKNQYKSRVINYMETLEAH